MLNRIDPLRIGQAGDAGAGVRQHAAPALLCVANFPANTGYAWDFIESLYAGIANRLAAQEIRTWVAYPSMPALPQTLRGSQARAVELEVRLNSVRSMRAVLDFVRRNDVRTVYLADRASWHPSYAALRLAGVRRIVVHDHTSGRRTVPRGLKRWLKRMRHRVPGALADSVLAVSNYVADRKIEVDLLPPARVQRIWNSVVVPHPDPTARSRIRALFGLAPTRPVIACACRTTPEKGVVHLVRAFDRLIRGWAAASEPPALVYFGDGPALRQLRAERDSLDAGRAIFLAGHRRDAADLIEGADVCVAPSVWEEAFGLYALEPLARGVPVIASSVGGMPEIVVDGETGLLVAPGDEAALENAMIRLIENPAEARRLGENGRRRAARHFSRDQQLEELLLVLTDGDSGWMGGAISSSDPGRAGEPAVSGAARSSSVAPEESRR